MSGTFALLGRIGLSSVVAGLTGYILF
jgi:hypothetical protein